MKKTIVLIVAILACTAFTVVMNRRAEPDPVYIPPSPQRSGDSKEGYNYLVTGDYLKSGIPYNYFTLGFGKNANTFLKREGLNKNVSYEYTVVKAVNGENVVAPNCLQCHAQVFENKLYIGLGNTTIDFSNNQKLDPKMAASAEQLLKSVDPQKYEASEPFLKVVKSIGGQMFT